MSMAAANRCLIVATSAREGIVALYAAPNPFLLNKICLNQLLFDLKLRVCVAITWVCMG